MEMGRCKTGFCPKDRDLDIVGTSFSPGVMGRVGSCRPFGLGTMDIKELADIKYRRQGNRNGIP